MPAAPPDWTTPPPTGYRIDGLMMLDRDEVDIIDVESDQLRHPSVCGTWAEGVALACARLLVPELGGGCVIYTTTRERWVIEHELAHCAGWPADHREE
jgi:hypothetical protein